MENKSHVWNHQLVINTKATSPHKTWDAFLLLRGDWASVDFGRVLLSTTVGKGTAGDPKSHYKTFTPWHTNLGHLKYLKSVQNPQFWDQSSSAPAKSWKFALQKRRWNSWPKGRQNLDGLRMILKNAQAMEVSQGKSSISMIFQPSCWGRYNL
jgi:hypothetical protein